jgi:8-oxo-dGTP diphosphatase
MKNPLPYKISTLIFLKDAQGRFLLLKRTKAPNKDCWSPIGGKLDMTTGESPFECAIRECKEETGLDTSEEDMHLFSIIAEKSFEGAGHWLMFLFDCHKPIHKPPPSIDEGHFAFFTRQEIDELVIPETDHSLLWPFYDKHHDGFVMMRADCEPGKKLEIVVEESLRGDI